MGVTSLIVVILMFNLDFSYGQAESISSSFGVGGGYMGEDQNAPEDIGTDCIDRKGKRVPVGKDYHPYGDSPCTICECMEDKMMMACSSTGCDALPCLDFEIDPDACCGYTCTENGSVGALDVRQVGKDSVIVQWTMDEDRSNVSFDHVIIHYNEAVTGDTPWVNLPVGKGADSALVSGLKPGIQYTFQGVGLIGASMYPSFELTLKAAQITIDGRVGNGLKLERRNHSRQIFIYENTGLGQFKWPSVLFLNLNAFDYISVGRKVTKKGNEKFLLRLHKINPGVHVSAAHTAKRQKGDLVLQFGDVKLFNWAMAHI